MDNVWKDIARKIHKLHQQKEILPLHEPSFIGNEKAYVMDCIEAGWVSSVGKYVDRFEEKLAEYTGVERAIAVMNGTAALHVALKLVGVKPADEVLVPSLTFVATANAVTYCGAEPHFVDVSRETLGMDPYKLDAHLQEISFMKGQNCVNKVTGNIIRAVVPMHTFGHSVDMDPLIDVCSRYNITVVEDAAESLGSFYKGKHTGNFGKVAALSFNGNKIITTGGGGAILTNDYDLADYAKHITTTAKLPHAWDYVHDDIGYNYRMPNINAALGCAQLEQIDEYLHQKRILTKKYEQIFREYPGIKLFKENNDSHSNYWLQAILLDQERYDFSKVLKELHEEKIMARPIWKPLHLLQPFADCQKSDLSITIQLQKEIINLPSSPYLGGDNSGQA
ncbi:LegC family aminotransferase [Lentibacillus saliphilus]|uniref:LegC family aminotransferase n=1 Tax=Lentibacillus saliphilus TaxID=2737028 RepID=UPI001C308C09|nr:LegC family aminotransferase [Lentibacillus saliphilus]